MNIKNYPLFAIVLLGSLLVGCTDDFDGFYEFDEYTPSVIMQANQLIESGKIKVSLLDLERAYMSETSKNSKSNSKRDFSIEWSDYRVKTEGTVDVVYVPIRLNKKKNQIFTLQTEDGRMKGFSHQFYCTLIMASGKDGKGFEAVMATYLYGGNMKEDDIKRMGRDFESSGYSGYYITSTLDGTMLSGRYFEDGECKFRFRQNPLPPSERNEVATKTKAMAESDTIRKHDHHGLHIFLNVNPLKRARMTKGSNNDMEWLMTHCSLCGKFYEDCTCVTVEDYPLCQYCHTDIINGRCGQACFYCDLCTQGPYHTHPNYSPELGGGYTPPSTGGGGGGNTGGGGDGDGGFNGTSPTYTNTDFTVDPQIITNSTTTALEYIQSIDPPDTINSKGKYPAKCNKGFRKMFELVVGYLPDYLDDKCANEIATALESLSQIADGHWVKLERPSETASENDWQSFFDNMQKLANKGYFVATAQYNPTGQGHVTVIVPCGDTARPKSGAWHGATVPTNFDTGAMKVRSTKQTLNNSHGTATAADVKFYYYR